MKQALEERRRFLEQEVANNKELGAAINVSDRGMAKLREEYNAELAEQRELSDEVDLAKNTVRASRRISCRRTRGTTRRWRTWRRSEGDWRRR